MIKKIEINGSIKGPHDIDLDKPIGGGKEGDIFLLGVTNYFLKWYHSGVLDETRKAKILDFCSLYETFNPLLGNEQYALPEAPAIEVYNREIIGFVMRNMGELPRIGDLSFSENDFNENNNFKLNDNTALELIYQMYNALLRLHQSNIILGDINPTNILYDHNKKYPIFVDIDSAQLGKYPCITFMEEYLDPIVKESGKDTDGSYVFNMGSDYFGLAVICYELFVGGLPYEFRTKPHENANVRKSKRICLMNFLEDSDFGTKYNIKLIERGTTKIWIERLRLLKNKDPLLYKYFFETFALDRRENLLTRLPKEDIRNPGYFLFNKEKGQAKTVKEILMENINKENLSEKIDRISYIYIDYNIKKLLKQHKLKYQYKLNVVEMPKDPKGFMVFVDNLGLGYSNLIRNGT